MNFQLNVSGQTLSIKQSLIAADTLDYLTAAVSLSAEWSGLSVWVHFKKGDTHYTIELTGNAITADRHLNLACGVWSVWLHGNAVSGGTVTQRITSSVAALNVSSTGSTAANPLPVTPASVGEQLLAKAANAESIARSVRADADAGAFNGETGANGQNGADCDYSLVANALHGKLSGTAMSADDVAPPAHELTVVQYGQCVQSGTPTPTAPIPITGKAAGAAVGDGTVITQTLTVTDANGDPVTLYGVPVTNGGNVTIGGQQYIADTLEGTTVTRRVGKIVFNGSENWVLGNGISSLTQCYSLRGVFPSGTTFISDQFMQSANTVISNNNIGYGYSGTYLHLNYDNTGADLAAFKAHLAQSPLTMYYVLTMPTTETVTLSPAALSANSPTTTWTSEAYSEVTYNRDINRAFADLTAAIISLGGNI